MSHNIEAANIPSPEGISNQSKTLLIFGIGPVIDSYTKVKASDEGTTPGNEGINFWSEGLADAAAILYETGVVNNFIVMGGRTGGEEYASEAELISKSMVVKGIPVKLIHPEKDSRETFDNITNFLNLVDEGKIFAPDKTYNALAVPYHAARVKMLMQLLDVPLDSMFVSTEVLRYKARSDNKGNLITGEKAAYLWDNETLHHLEEIEDIDQSQSRFYPGQKGTEQRTYKDYYVKYSVYGREVLVYPQKLLHFTGYLHNDERVYRILHTVERLFPGILSANGITAKSSISEIRKILTNIEYSPLSDALTGVWSDEEQSIGWPYEVIKRYNMLLEERGNNEHVVYVPTPISTKKQKNMRLTII